MADLTLTEDERGRLDHLRLLADEGMLDDARPGASHTVRFLLAVLDRALVTLDPDGEER